MKQHHGLRRLLLLTLFLAVLILPALPARAASAMKTSFHIVNTWKQGGDTYVQMTVTLRNPKSVKITNWNLTLNMDRKITFVSGWNAKYSVSARKLKVRPAGYNKKILPGGSCELGFIIKARGKAVCKTVSGTVWNGKKKHKISKNVGKKTGTTAAEPEIKPTSAPTPTPTPTLKPSGSSDTSKTPLQKNGRLKVKGTYLVNEKGSPVVLKGVSTHGINWFPQFVNKEAFRTLRDQWGVQCIRLAMYTEEYNGYCSGGNREELKKTLTDGVRYATELGMYVIIDWHILSDGSPAAHQADAKTFFKEMSAKYKNQKNVIYEICNEPNGGTSWSTIKAYARSVIKTIRANDKNAVILVGTPNWSQDVDAAADNPITGYQGIMYTFHFYAATHGEDYRKKVETALGKGLPVFVSEFGISEASGNGAVDKQEGNRWISFLNKNKISYVCWNFSNKGESSSLLKSSCTRTSGFADGDLSAEGKWYRDVEKNG